MAKTATIESRVHLDGLAHQLSYLEREDTLDFVEELDQHVSDTGFTVALIDRLIESLKREDEHVETPAMSAKYPDHRLLMKHRGLRVWLNRKGMYITTTGDEPPSDQEGYVYLSALLQQAGL